MGRIISVSNQKGGVGKTTTINALSSVLRQKQFRVLCIDFDPQGNLSFGLNADFDTAPTIYDVLKKEISAKEAIQNTDIGAIIPSNILLSSTEVEFTGKGREFLLRDALKPVVSEYDYIMIDTPPGLGILTINAFAASDSLIIPLLPDIYSLQGIARIYESIERIRQICNPRLKIAGFFLTQFAPRQKLSQEVQATAEMIANDLHIPLLRTTVRRSVELAKAQTVQADIATFSPYNGAILDYVALTEELLGRGL